jgi:hypothetical protein
MDAFSMIAGAVIASIVGICLWPRKRKDATDC